MKIVIISGGSGNDALIKGLKKIFNNSTLDINVIVNAYDNGKSTGVCRAVTDTLGVSDIRKNHSRMYEASFGDKVNKNLLDFYEKRFDFDKGKEEKQILELLKGWGLIEYKHYLHNFFKNPKAKNFEYKNFSVSNIIYSQMFKEIGYEKTNKHFCDKLGIDDFVTLNSFDNVFIKSKTQSGYVIEDEGEMVCWNNPNNKIVGTIYEGKSVYGLNPRAINLVNEADYIIISTGTFWSSIQPTIEYLDFYKYINNSKAKKVWVMNNEEDGDSFGVKNLEFCYAIEKIGLNLDDFTILLNNDARESMRQTDDKHKFVFKSMDNNKGKHNGEKYAKAIMQVYYDLDIDFDKILFDFDDTIWARAISEDNEKISQENVVLLNNTLANKSIIISGNSYESIHEKLSKIYGTDLKGFKIDVWADANALLYRQNKVVKVIKEMTLGQEAEDLIKQLHERFGLNPRQIGPENVNYRIKPLSQLERKLLIEIINNSNKKTNIVARATGKTTVDILNKNNTKALTYKYCNLGKQKTLYIGDEIDDGNDRDIARVCTKSIKIKNIGETNILIKILGE